MRDEIKTRSSSRFLQPSAPKSVHQVELQYVTNQFDYFGSNPEPDVFQSPVVRFRPDAWHETGLLAGHRL